MQHQAGLGHTPSRPPQDRAGEPLAGEKLPILTFARLATVAGPAAIAAKPLAGPPRMPAHAFRPSSPHS